MKERSIIFSGESVRAILEGRKTQTRRLAGLEDVNGYPGLLDGTSPLGPLGYKGFEITDYNLKPSMKKQFKKNPRLFHRFLGERRSLNEINPIPVRCPYGAPGDRLWVRETFYKGNGPTWGSNCIVYAADKAIGWMPGTPFDDPDLSQFIKNSSIFMPRWASRITLELTGVRAERVQEISEADICAETGAPLKWPGPGPEPYGRVTKTAFANIWDSLNAHRGYPWAINPWVWVLEFKKVQP